MDKVETTSQPGSNPSGRFQACYRTGRRLAFVSGFFVLLVAALMAADLYFLRISDPLDTPALAALIGQLARDPANETLQQQVRELDLMARSAFFVRQGHFEAGVRLLVGGLIAWILSLQLMVSGRKRMPDPKACSGLDDPWWSATRARRIVTVGGLTLLALILAGSLGARRDLRLPDTDGMAVFPTATPEAAYESPVSPAPVPAPEADLTASVPTWPSFRGFRGLGSSPDADPPTDWDGTSGKGVLWKTELPRAGYNSPVVWADRVFLTGADENDREVYCFDADTGERLWTVSVVSVLGVPDPLPEVTDDTGFAAPTVATDGRRVVALFGTGAILGLDFEGRLLWAHRLEVPDNPYGHASSPLVHDNTVYIQYDHFGGSNLIALDAETGRTRWNVDRQARISWASPILVETDGRMQIILSAEPMVAAYDAVTGAALWVNECMSGEIGSSPAYANGRIFAANQYARAVALDVATGRTLWETTRLEMPDAGSPVATDRHLFLSTSYGAFSCVDVTNGQLIWEHDFARGGYGSPVLAGDRLYWITEDGVTRIFKAAESFELIAEPELGEPSVSTPALVGRRLYVRGERHLFCIGPE